LAWLAGLLDADGTVCRQETSEAFQLSSVNKAFLLSIRLMLHTLGVDSKVNLSRKEGDYFLPDGHGSLKEYHCQPVYRLLISSYGLHRLAVLGLRTNRLKWVTRDPGRNGERYIRVDSVERTGRISDVFCFHETKRNMGMFNGLLLHQCVESYSVVTPGKYAHSCNLDSINLANVSEEELPHVCETAVRLLDNTIDITTAPFQDAKAHNDRYRTIGVGAMGLADWLAKRQLSYKSVDKIGELFENIGYYCTRASVDLAKERGAYTAFEGSEWSKGHLIGAKPIEWYRENAYEVERWEALGEDVQQYGIRNSHITAIAPNTSSSLVQGCTASILPAYSKFFYDKWAKGTVPIAPPFIGEAFWFYHENKSMDQQIVVKAVAEMQKWIDTGISMELIFNLNKGVYFPDEEERALKAKDIFEVMMLAWKEGCKAIYYIRTVQKDDFKEGGEACSSCAN
jgi:ribonucleoside-diphosphate reductase alpha chain